MTRPLTPDERARVAEETALAATIAAELPAMPVPYFARLRVRTAAGERDVLLGERSFDGAAATLVDWRTAPLAAVFLAHGEGDDYELELDGRELHGALIRRHAVHFIDGALIRIDLDDTILQRDNDGTWTAEPRTLSHPAPRPANQRTRPLSPAHVQLDPAQRAAVELATDRSLLVLGEAGFGKTTVALHRLAFLAHAAAAARDAFRALVIVPTPGLQRLATRMLAELDVRSVMIETFERWIAGQARRLFPELPRRFSENSSPTIRALKRHPALRTVLPQIVAKTPAMREVEAGYRDTRATIRELLLHLFGDRLLMEAVAAAAAGELEPGVVAEVLAHTRVQFTTTTERALRHIDRERLQTLDGRPIDAGTPLADAGSIDREDLAIVFALHHRLTGGDRTAHGALSYYQHLLLDEAQELAPIELELLARAVAPGGTVTVAGDHRQQVDTSTTFPGWPAVLGELRQDSAETVELAISYRCPPAIEQLARAILDPALPAPQGPDEHLLVTRHDNQCHLVIALVDGLLALQRDDPRVQVAIVCRHLETARRLHHSLAPALAARLVEGGAFSFTPGIDVTTVHDVKGLEFDVVVVPDLDAATYPDRPDARRALYVAVTRPLHRLWLAGAGRPSPLLGTCFL